MKADLGCWLGRTGIATDTRTLKGGLERACATIIGNQNDDWAGAPPLCRKASAAGLFRPEKRHLRGNMIEGAVLTRSSAGALFIEP